MKLIPLLLLALLFTACAETHVRWGKDGKLSSFVIAGDTTRVHFANHGNDVEFTADNLRHTEPTDARGRNITRAGDSGAKVIGGVVMGIGTKGILK